MEPAPLLNHSAVANTLQLRGLSFCCKHLKVPVKGRFRITLIAFTSKTLDGSNSGDTYHSATFTVNEGLINSINNISSKNQMTFNTITKTIESKTILSVYDIRGKLVLITNSNSTNISHLNPGIYILKSENKTQKIILN